MPSPHVNARLSNTTTDTANGLMGTAAYDVSNCSVVLGLSLTTLFLLSWLGELYDSRLPGREVSLLIFRYEGLGSANFPAALRSMPRKQR